MPWPKVNGFGIVENPLVYDTYGENNGPQPEPNGRFLLLSGGNFQLLSGGDLLLLDGA